MVIATAEARVPLSDIFLAATTAAPISKTIATTGHSSGSYTISEPVLLAGYPSLCQRQRQSGEGKG